MYPARLARPALARAPLRRPSGRAPVLTPPAPPRAACHRVVGTPLKCYTTDDRARPPPDEAAQPASGTVPAPSSPASSAAPPAQAPVARDDDNIDPDRKLHLVFTCAKCETRATKSFSKAAYERGVVIVTCPGCGARHLIADNLGWFGAERNVEEILASNGVSTARITDRDFEHVP